MVSRYFPAGAAILLLLVLAGAPPADARTITAGPGGEAATISEALAQARAGDTVSVLPGTYRESVRVTVPVTLEGFSGAGNLPVIAPSGDGIVVQSTGATLRDLSLAGSGAGTGIRITGSENGVRNVTVSGFTYGILIATGTGNGVSGCSITGATRAGLVILAAGKTTVTDNTIAGNRVGLYIGETAENNRVWFNDFRNTVNAVSGSRTTAWEPESPVSYQYSGAAFMELLGNFWGDYKGIDKDGNGIGTAPYTSTSKTDAALFPEKQVLIRGAVKDAHPLVLSRKFYTLTPETPKTPPTVSPTSPQQNPPAAIPGREPLALLLPALALLGVGIVVGAVILYAAGRQRTRVRPAPDTIVEPAEAGKGTDLPAELASRYRNTALISSGGIGKVYSAVRRSDGVRVALKIPVARDAVTGTSFLKEITAWMHLGHPNIARIYDANILPIPYVEMEYLPRTLADLPRPVPPGESVRLVAGILSAVAYAHAQGIVHRDLKPRNILLAPDGTPKVADWGLSRTRLAREEVTLVGYSRRYAAPEQLAGHPETGTDERTDVFQAGIILYELLTGRPPFAGEDYEQPPVLPSSVHPALARFDPIIRKCLDPDPARRYQTAGEFRRALSGPG